MASLPSVVEPVIDIESLLQPISADAPAGQDLRFETVPDRGGKNPKYWYDAIREAATEDLLAEGGNRYADWDKVIALSQQALRSHSKDLQIATWLVEAYVKHHRFDQFAGLRDGLWLLHGLLANFWETLYPVSDLEDPDGYFTVRANVLERWQNRLALAIKRVPLTQGELGLRYSFNQHEYSKLYKVTGLDEDAAAALRAQLQEDNQGTLTTELRITDEDWAKAHQTTAHTHYVGRLQVLNECVAAFDALDGLLEEKFQREAPSLKNLSEALDAVQRLVRVLEQETRQESGLDTEAASAAPSFTTAPAAVALSSSASASVSLSVSAGALRSRQEALQRLSEVAAYFRQTEPHTPVALLVERAVRWGHLPFDKLLTELIKDSAELGRLRELLGLPSDAG